MIGMPLQGFHLYIHLVDQPVTQKDYRFMDKKLLINLQNVPKHVAIIMDGNGRWAKSKGMSRVFGHKNALTAVRESVKAATKLVLKQSHSMPFLPKTGTAQNWK